MTPVSLDSMTDDELRTHVRLTAIMLATRHHKKHNPTAAADDSATFAERNWRQFRATAVDFLALTEADRQARTAAPWN